MDTLSIHRASMDTAMRQSGIATDRNSPHEPKPFTDNAITVLKRRYVRKDPEGQPIELPDDVFPRVAHNLAQADALYLPDTSPDDIAQRLAETERLFLDLMQSHLLLPNSPTLMNAGALLQQLSACFVLPVGDSLEEIFQSVKETALIHKSGGGTGFSFSRIRQKDDIVGTTGGVASGPVGFIRAFDVATDVVKQGGTRRGANMAVLRVDHPDILEFVHSKDSGNALENFNISVAITDKFMAALENGTHYNLVNPRNQAVTSQLNAKDVWDQIVSSAHLTGDPGLIFLDTINRDNPNPHLGEIEAVNPCVTGDTLVHTSKGLLPISDMLHQSPFHTIVTDGRFNNGLFNHTTAVMHSGRKPVYNLTTKEGYKLRLTKDHKVMTTRGWVPAEDLRQGDLVHINNTGGAFGPTGDYETGALMGWLIADGTFSGVNKPSSSLLFHGEKRSLAPLFASMLNNIVPQGQGPRRTYTVAPSAVLDRDLETVNSTRLARLLDTHGIRPGQKHHVPTSVLQGSEPMQRGFLQALFSADGTILTNPDKGNSIRLSSSYPDLLNGVQQLLLNFRIASRIYLCRRPATTKAMPDGKGGLKDYETLPNHELSISKQNIATFRDTLGFLLQSKQDKLKQALNNYTHHPRQERFLARFQSLTYDSHQEVYDLTEPTSHSFVANGIVVSNCGEQILLPNESCNLASINLARMVTYPDQEPAQINWPLLAKVSADTVHLLDNVIDMNRHPTPEVEKVTRSTRRIGVGVMGFADMLLQLGLPYDSQEARDLAQKLMSFIRLTAHDASADLAATRGAYPEYQPGGPALGPAPNRPMRNTAPTTIAPTGTISIIAGASGGIEPLFALAYTRNVMDQTKLQEINPYFLAAAKAHGFYSDDLMDHVASTGSIQQAQVPPWAKEVFKTAQDISPEDHVLMQAAFQTHVDNAVSKTINFPNQATKDDIETAYLLAYNSGCKGITVYRDGSKAGQVLSTGNTANPANPAEPATNGAHPPMGQARPRPRTMSGTTERVRTAHGNVYVTTNRDEHANPFELFCQVGKAGSCDSAQIEAISRLISLALRANLDPDEIITNLRGISCCPTWDQGTRINSVPDAIAQSLFRTIHPDRAGAAQEALTITMALANFEPPDPAPGLSALQTTSAPLPLCPDCQGPTAFKEGCQTCLDPGCAWNKCE